MPEQLCGYRVESTGSARNQPPVACSFFHTSRFPDLPLKCIFGQMKSSSASAIRVLLADDDVDDCLLFEEALAEIPIPTSLSVVNDGEQLLKRLLTVGDLPEVLFLDLNMPRKNGFDCLQEIKKHDRTKDIPVIIISTSFDPDIVQLLFAKGAWYYICKPSRFQNLRDVIHRGLSLIADEKQGEITTHHIVLNP